MSDKTRWGILGPGNIAKQFARGLQALEDAELTAVGSRSQEKADVFGDEFDVNSRHASYEALAQDKSVDAIYISTPHPYHMENTLLCIENGKAVLCEKPLAVNSAQVAEMLSAAKKKNTFLMEAMWTHFFPAMLKMKELIREGAIGEVRMMDVKFNFRSGWNPEGRLLNPDLAGGGLLDVGVYDIAFAQMVMGTAPSEIISSAHLGETGVDEQAGIVFKYSNGALAVLTCAVRTSTPHTASVYGTEGWIEVPPLFWQPDRFVLHTDEKNEEFAFERLGNGYSYEAQHVHECLKEDKKESDIIPHSLSVDVMKAMDEIRSQWNLRYPFE